MTQRASHASAAVRLDSPDFDEHYHFVKKLIQELKGADHASLRKEIFGEDERNRNLTKKEIKELARALRKIEHQYEECCNPPVPAELESFIRSRSVSDWLPYEQEAIEKVDAWRADIKGRRDQIRQMLQSTLNKYRGQAQPV
jgi:DNA repair exonuclease SbcCD ATPase subunit